MRPLNHWLSPSPHPWVLLAFRACSPTAQPPPTENLHCSEVQIIDWSKYPIKICVHNCRSSRYVDTPTGSSDIHNDVGCTSLLQEVVCPTSFRKCLLVIRSYHQHSISPFGWYLVSQTQTPNMPTTPSPINQLHTSPPTHQTCNRTTMAIAKRWSHNRTRVLQ